MQTEYFVLTRTRSQEHPLLAWDQSGMAFRKRKPVDVYEPVKLKLADPVPPHPVMADHHALPAPVVSTRLMEVFATANLHGVQLVPADVHAGNYVLRYWLLHVWRAIDCLDRERSVFQETETGRVLLAVDRLELDKGVLDAVPLKERLAFRLEGAAIFLFHFTVVNRALSLTPPPIGLRFIPVAEWGDSTGFR